MTLQDIINIALLLLVVSHTVSIIIMQREQRRFWILLDQMAACIDRHMGEHDDE